MYFSRENGMDLFRTAKDEHSKPTFYEILNPKRPTIGELAWVPFFLDNTY